MESVSSHPTAEGLLAKKAQKDVGPKGPFKYPRARQFFTTVQASHTRAEIEKLLYTCLEFPNLGFIKLKLEMRFPGIDGLAARIDKRRLNR